MRNLLPGMIEVSVEGVRPAVLSKFNDSGMSSTIVHRRDACKYRSTPFVSEAQKMYVKIVLSTSPFNRSVSQRTSAEAAPSTQLPGLSKLGRPSWVADSVVWSPSTSPCLVARHGGHHHRLEAYLWFRAQGAGTADRYLPASSPLMQRQYCPRLVHHPQPE
ncbi:hypothetical protein N657DRAFT_96543 [Parathielavia appendiculata]|uniref:Uncharacterized protein n=1 Tax=Parathielavia appendiculata TaxID=2587402 RepID=A0AAN6Z1E0_9PEZI|nr:hypothetical protein N657DRAFT_96543 [Parathielavia appendiculata]